LTRTLLRCGLVAGPLFLGIATAEGLHRPDYRASRHPISSLALGPRGWVQVANFTASGTLCLAFAAGLARAQHGAVAGPSLIALTAGGMLACAPFTADPVNGYPPGTPPTPEQMTRAGLAHLIASSVVMIGVPATTAIHGWQAHRRGQRVWARLSAAATGVTMASFAAACAGFAQVSALPRVAGALQRVAVTGGFIWLAALAARTLRSRPS
jgi:hypothetical protein